MTQSSAAQIVASYVSTTLEMVQRDQTSALGYSIMERSVYYGCKTRIYLYAHHIRTY